jgi:iron complex transport system substrate-binding protein
LLVEIKSVEQLHAAHAKQLLTYFASPPPVGLLINFGGATLKEGTALVNDYQPSRLAPPREPK